MRVLTNLPHHKNSRKYKVIAYLTILVPFGVFVYTIFNFKQITTYPVTDYCLFLIFYLLSTIVISVGFHRGFAHKSYSPTRLTKCFLAILGSIATQGSIVFWVATHRRHHVYSDTSDDIHSPNMSSNRFLGFLHAHILWMTKGEISNPTRFAKDITQDKDLQWINQKYLTWVVLGIVTPGILAFATHATLQAFLEGVIWGGFMRIFAAHHITWALNSLAHLFGKKLFVTDDQSHNIPALAIISMGESWHNNHHAFPFSARFGVLKGQLDIGYFVIRTLGRFGLVADIKTPTSQHIRTHLI